MEIFNNLTNSGKEKATKIGTRVPAGAAGLSWFTSESISPVKNVFITDVSGAIAENKIKETLGSEIMYADELGILRRLNGSSSIATQNITISNSLIHKATVTERIDIDTINPESFSHYFYTSRYFAVAPSSIGLFSLDQYIKDDIIISLGIKVLDQFGKDYINPITNKRKYKILLEPFRTEDNDGLTEIPYRILVFLDSQEPINLRLMYNKVESDELGNISGFQLRYSETINPVKYFKELPEESFVIDPNYYGSKIFAIKKIDQKYTNINVNGEPIQNGYQVIVPSKAIKDYRTYEVFNWRIIARIKKTLNFDMVDYSTGSSSTNFSRTVKAGVICTTKGGDNTNAYAIYRLENSPFNLTRLAFENPLAETGILKSDASYWKMNIDTTSSTDIAKYDVLIWSPDEAITTAQADKINSFTKDAKGTVILDLSLCPDASKVSTGSQLTMSSSATATTVDMIDNNYLIDSNKNGGWSLLDNIFEKNYYGIFGSRLMGGNASRPKAYKYFSNVAVNNTFVKAGATTSSQYPIGVIIPASTSSDNLSKGNIIATTFNLLAYCNSIYDLASSEKVTNSNNGSSHYGTVGDGQTAFSAIVEGPFKLLFNAVSYAIHCKSESSREETTASSLINLVTDWDSSWVMYSEALLESEKKGLFSDLSLTTSESVSARNLTADTSSNNNSIFTYVKKKMSDKLPNLLSNLLSEIDVNDVTFYIEATNPDVKFNGAQIVINPEQTENIPSSYSLHKVTTSSTAKSPLLAYTKKHSPSLELIGGLGPHLLIERPTATSSTKNLDSSIGFSTGFNSYPFELSSRFTSFQGVDSPSSFDCDLSATATLTIGAQSKVVTTWPPTVPSTPTNPAPIDKIETIEAINFKSAIDDLGLLREKNINKATNVFPYTGDIDIHGKTDEWKSGTSKHEYIQYIQYTLAAHGSFKAEIEGNFGPKTKAAVLAFQKANKQLYEDGIVDSETKWYLAKFWLDMRTNNRTLFDNWGLYASANFPNVKKYINAVKAMGTVQSINSDKTYKKISFSGTKGPSEVFDIIYFKIPVDMLKVNKIIIKAGTGSKWRNFKVAYVGWSSTYGGGNVFKYDGSRLLDLSAKTGTVTIPMNGMNRSDVKYMFISVSGGKVSGFGEAEGFSIDRIDVKGTVKTVPPAPEPEDPPTQRPPTTNYFPIEMTVTVSISGTVESVSPSTSQQVRLDNLDRIKSLTSLTNGSHYISAIRYPLPTAGQYKTITLTSSDGITLSSINYENADVKVASFSAIKTTIPIVLSGISLSNIISAGKPITTGTPVSVSNDENTLTLETSQAYYTDPIVQTTKIDLSTNYMKKVSGVSLPGVNKNTINYGDGILLFCNADGNPIGIPTATQIKTAINDVPSQNKVKLAERDLQYGVISVSNKLSDDGIRYGFYDVQQKKFLGNNLNYIDLYSRFEGNIDTGVNSIFIAICALDADGRPGDNEFYGANNSSTFIPSRVPLKYLVPVYSVRYNSSSSIKVNEISPNLSKFDSWELPVSSGTFSKQIEISPTNEWFDWKKNYKGQRLLAQYSTLDQQDVSWSKIYGHGYYDVVDEYPIIMDSKNIKVKRTPILNWNHPTNYLPSIAGLTKSEIKVFTKETEGSDWVEVPYRSIKDVNSHTGVVTFKGPLVPSNNSFIKVSYTTENKNLLLRHVNGNPIPLNPLLNAGSIQFDKPLYIYLTPKNIYKKKDGFYAAVIGQVIPYVEVLDHNYTQSVNFTYDPTIFDILSTSYDPFALMIAAAYVTNDPNREAPKISDLRLRGGGVKADLENSELSQIVTIQVVGQPHITGDDILSYWDMYPAQGDAYTRGGYVIIRLPKEVKDNFIDEKEIYNIIHNNLTAGVVFDLQDMNGDDWI